MISYVINNDIVYVHDIIFTIYDIKYIMTDMIYYFNISVLLEPWPIAFAAQFPFCV
jgi:hypothetical protein